MQLRTHLVGYTSVFAQGNSMPTEGESRQIIAQNEAAESFTLFKATVEAIGDAVVVTSADLDPPGPLIEYVNPAFCRMTGYAAADVLGRTPRMFQGELTDRAELDRLRTCLAAGETFAGEVVNYRKDGQPHVIEWLVTAISDPDGRVLHWLSVQRDVSARKQLEHRQDLLVAELHHRTRNLLSVVSAIAARTLPRSTARDSFDARLASLGRVQGFLSGKATWVIALDDLVRAELEAAGESAAERVTFGGPPVALPGDKVQPLALALHELFTNAVRHGALSRPDGRLEIRWHIAEDARLTLVWRESGVAITGAVPRSGFGMELIERALRYQLTAETRHEFGADGVCCTITLPTDAFR